MKQISLLPQGPELEMLKSMLEDAGVQCLIKNEQLSQVFPATPFNVELWVANDEDFPRAQELCQAWLNPPRGAAGTWACAKCEQRLGDQFDSCWKCGAKRPASAKLNKEEEDDENVSRFVD